MKAMVFHGPRDVRYEDFPEPKLKGKYDVIVRIQKCSICGSDLHMYNGKKVGPVDYSHTNMQFCVGHEGIGEVVEVGSEVKAHAVGYRVLLAGGVGCGRCGPCRRGAFNLCEAGAVMPYGFSPMLQGLQAESAIVKQADISPLKIPEGVSDEQALMLTDSLATGFMGAKKAQVQPGSTVAVIGQGPIGKIAAESAFALGAERVFVIEPSEFRRAKAKDLGAIALTPEEARDRIKEQTRGLGVDCCIEAVGKEETVKQAIRLTCSGGNVSVLGVLERHAKTALMPAQLKSLTLFVGVAGVADSWPELVPLVQQEGGRHVHRAFRPARRRTGLRALQRWARHRDEGVDRHGVMSMKQFPIKVPLETLNAVNPGPHRFPNMHVYQFTQMTSLAQVSVRVGVDAIRLDSGVVLPVEKVLMSTRCTMDMLPEKNELLVDYLTEGAQQLHPGERQEA